MRLFVAEKPSLARAIAEALPGPRVRTGDAICCGNEDVVAWCAGHILEAAPPDAYAPEFKAWRLDHLPIVPATWKLVASNAGLLKTIASLLRRADRVVHAGDPDREGQLLIDEVLHFLSYRGPVDRILVSDLSPQAVRKALGRIEPNSKYRPLYESALARQRADWLFGMNMTRLYTILGRQGGYDGVLSVGRVQTPLLGLIVARDRLVESFQPVPYFTVEAIVTTGAGASLRAAWVPGEDFHSFLDEDGRLLHKDSAETVRARTQGESGVVVSRVNENKTEAPPLPYALADLQVDASRKLGLSAAEVLDACQNLYELHRLVTYPRSDCAHLPEGHFPQAPSVVGAIAKNAPELCRFIENADLARRTKAWNDKKITAHHAIIPTSSVVSTTLNERDRAIYDLIARRYLGQFCGAHEYAQTRLDVLVAGQRFRATGKQTLAEGWRVLTAGSVTATDDESKPRDEADNPSLPALAEGDSVVVAPVIVASKKTTPPKPFNDASLIQAMCNVAKYVNNPAVQKVLTDTDGIGTPATRAAIIETLFERGFIVRQRRSIISTSTGRALVDALPKVATTPDMTAVWETAMRSICQEQQSLDAFLRCVGLELHNLVRTGKNLGSLAMVKAAPSNRPAKRGPPPYRTSLTRTEPR